MTGGGPLRGERIAADGRRVGLRRHNGHAVLTAAANREIREIYREGGYTFRTLGSIYGVHHSRIAQIVNESPR